MSLRPSPHGHTALPRLDWLRLPLIGGFLRWKHARLGMQSVMAVLAALLVVEGLFGPELAPKNLSTLLVWVYWRGALVLGLLLLGNVFCMGCPLMLPRELFRRIREPRRTWPRVLRRKWIGLGLFALALFTYEWLDLWASPAATAWAIIAYFAAALFVDALFRGASFCKWVCPVGQFNFIASTLSPFEVKARDHTVCQSCTTKDCIKGTFEAPAAASTTAPRRVQRGCELDLFLPAKVGNIDCTFCLDCVHACPEDNVAVALRLPAEELRVDPMRSGLGRLSNRSDLAALTVVFAFGALLNAFGMVGPVYALQRCMAARLGTESDFVILGILFVLGLAVLPLITVGATAWLADRKSGQEPQAGALARAFSHARRFSFTLAPLGFGVWLAHYCFHFLTGLWTFIPVAQHAAERHGLSGLGRPQWGLGGLHEAWVWPIEVGFVLFGLIGSLAVTWSLAERDFGVHRARAFRPWAGLHLVYACTALWLLAQPMEMRGTFL
ncbi:quinol dehydrogenase membrane component [Planctomycetes bacterium Poly30]|uniref:Quinol dehydrogenase membrane component n=1 Tax=Saltatorellus ferox TaxID=2528018 RepID=A0A518EKM9_9BACT|nr:quinol dehydrogenase membrane component [Planctomycetes bacterium Poly30]